MSYIDYLLFYFRMCTMFVQQPLHYILVFLKPTSSQEVIKDLLLVVLSDEHERLVMEGQFTQYYRKFQLSNRILICLIEAKLP